MEPSSRLSPLQLRILETLASLDPPFTLTGGGALAGFHLGHRVTRDLDLFWHGRRELGEVSRAAERRLQEAGLTVEHIERSPAFSRLRVAGEGEVVVLDLVAEPVPVVEAPRAIMLGKVASILVDTPHEILVNKLCTLLGRSEVRDLVDVRALVSAGGDLKRAVLDAPRKDGGFSPLTLAYVLRSFPVERLAASVGMSEPEAAALRDFRDDLVTKMTAWTRDDA